MIAITGLAKAYGSKRVLQDLSLSVDAGEVALLVGANGCGKSTTLRLLAGLTTPDAGRIVLAGVDRQREVLQHALRAVGLGETGDGDHL